MNEDRYQNGSLRGRSGIPRVGSAAGRSEAESSRPARFRVAGGTAARLAEQERRDADSLTHCPVQDASLPRAASPCEQQAAASPVFHPHRRQLLLPSMCRAHTRASSLFRFTKQ